MTTLILWNDPGTPASPAPLAALLSRMESHQLDPWWLSEHGEYFHLAHACIDGGVNPETYKRIYIDTGPIYPERPYTVRFCGNFLTYSHGFCIDTDDDEVIEFLDAAIRTNLLKFGFSKNRKP